MHHKKELRAVVWEKVMIFQSIFAVLNTVSAIAIAIVIEMK